MSEHKRLAETIRGDAPLPEPVNLQFIKDIENLNGNERLRRILDEQADLMAKYSDWHKKEATATKRLPLWNLLKELDEHTPETKEAEKLLEQIEAIRVDRLLFHEPDLVEPLVSKTASFLKECLNDSKKKFLDLYQKNMNELQNNNYFKQLTPEQKHTILQKYQLLAKPEVKELDAGQVNNELKNNSLEQWTTKVSALPEQFRAALEEAMKLAVPDAKSFRLPRQTISNKTEMNDYLNKLKQGIEELLDGGNTVILK